MNTPRPYLGENCVTPGNRRRVMERWLWALIQNSLFRWSPRPMHRWRAWLLKQFGADIGDVGKVVVFPSAKIVYPRQLTLENRAMIGPNVTVYNLGRITLRYGANISQGCHLCAGSHDHNRWDMPLTTQPIEIGENVWLAADVFVGPGVTIGKLSVVGARSVAVTDLPADSICVGNPCRPVKPRQAPVASPSP